jgi:hypothetical protein
MSASWSFKGTAFRRAEPADQPRSWPQSLQRSVDVVAGDPSASPRRYVDIGAVQLDAWAFRAGCPTQAARDALVAARYTSGALIAIGGDSYTALCTKATPLVHDGSGWFYVDLEFERL